MQKLKPAITNCVLQGRKFISERDVLVAAEIQSAIPRSSIKSRDRGYLFESGSFKNICQAHIASAQEILHRLKPESDTIKISSEVCLLFQELVEEHMRGFFEYLAQSASSNRRVFGYKECAKALTSLIGHAWNDV